MTAAAIDLAQGIAYDHGEDHDDGVATRAAAARAVSVLIERFRHIG